MNDSDYSPSLDDNLYHYGVKGMKWGVRKDQNKITRSTSVTKKRRSKADIVKQRKEQSDKIITIVEKGAKKAAKVMNAVGRAHLIDQMFFDGVGSSAIETALDTIGGAIARPRR